MKKLFYKGYAFKFGQKCEQYNNLPSEEFVCTIETVVSNT